MNEETIKNINDFFELCDGMFENYGCYPNLAKKTLDEIKTLYDTYNNQQKEILMLKAKCDEATMLYNKQLELSRNRFIIRRIEVR